MTHNNKNEQRHEQLNVDTDNVNTGHRSLLPEQFSTPIEWRPYDICRKISVVSKTTTSIADRIKNHKLTTEEMNQISDQLNTLSHTLDHIADTLQEDITQAIASSLSCMLNSEILGHGKIL
jgi:hypothetical protein